MKTFIPIVILSIVLLIISQACFNIFEWAYTPGDSDNPQQKYYDAEMLRKNQNFEGAACIYNDILSNENISNTLRANAHIGLSTALMLRFFGYDDMVEPILKMIPNINQSDVEKSEDNFLDSVSLSQFIFPNPNISQDPSRPLVPSSVLRMEQLYHSYVDYSLRVKNNIYYYLNCVGGGNVEFRESIIQNLTSVRQNVPRVDMRYVMNEVNNAVALFFKIFISLMDTNNDLHINSNPDIFAGETEEVKIENLDLVIINVERYNQEPEEGEEEEGTGIAYNFRTELTDPEIIEQINNAYAFADQDITTVTEDDVNDLLTQLNSLLDRFIGFDNINRNISSAITDISKHLEDAVLVSLQLVEEGQVGPNTCKYIKDIKDVILSGDDAVLDRLWEFRRDNIAVRALMVLQKLQLLRFITLVNIPEIPTREKLTSGSDFDVNTELHTLSASERNLIQDYFTDLCIENADITTGTPLVPRQEADMFGLNVECDPVEDPDSCPAVLSMDFKAIDCWNRDGVWTAATNSCSVDQTCD